MLPAVAAVAPELTGEVIKTAQEALKTGVIGTRTVTTYHYAKKEVMEESSFTFRLWEAALAAGVATVAYGIWKWSSSRGGTHDQPWDIFGVDLFDPFNLIPD